MWKSTSYVGWWVCAAVTALACVSCDGEQPAPNADTQVQGSAATQRLDAIAAITGAYGTLPESLAGKLGGRFKDDESRTAEALEIRQDAVLHGAEIEALQAAVAQAADQPPSGTMQGVTVLDHLAPLRGTAKLAMAHLMEDGSDRDRWCKVLNDVLRVLKGQGSVVERSAGVSIAIQALDVGAVRASGEEVCTFTAFGNTTADAMDVAGAIVLLKESYAVMIRKKDPYLKEVGGVDFDVVRQDSEGLAAAVEVSMDAIAQAWKTDKAMEVITVEVRNFAYPSCKVFISGFDRVHKTEMELRTRLEAGVGGR